MLIDLEPWPALQLSFNGSSFGEGRGKMKGVPFALGIIVLVILLQYH